MNVNRGAGRGSNPWHRGRQNQNNFYSQATAQISAEEKFKSARDEAAAAIQKHVQNESESSSDEENLESESILSSVLKNYSQLSGTSENLGRTQQFLENSFQSGAGVCLICIESIKRIDPIWSCKECYGFFHILCIQKWARDNIFQQKRSLEELPNYKKTFKLSYTCPKCRHEYAEDEIPQRYFCFCGKTEDPLYQAWLVPHSCGEVCEKYLKPECGHQCLLLCHPGPCPPCPKTVQIYCHCNKQGPAHKRCSDKVWSCNSKCSKPLLCKKHSCEKLCHPGDCPPCGRESIQKCMCGLQSRKQPCTTPQWQCDKVCGKPFSCGFHDCSVTCHKGACGDCPLSLERTCPCGKSLSTLPCTQEVPTCNDTCGKLLECGAHICSQKCHKDNCGTCLEIVSKGCRCGHHKKELPCQKEFLCETKCRQIKNCLRHPCNRKCCDSQCPPCEKPCGRTLTCGNHKCPSVCHRGPCYPCPQVAQVKCRCGSTAISVPCGRQKKTKPPRCTKLCSIPPDCHHPSREPHRCHFGDCAPCRQICHKKRESCSHFCTALCHSAVLLVIEEDRRPAGPWEKIETQVKRCDTPCESCREPVPVTCLGGHETSNWPCFQAKPSSCQRPCGRALKCGNHTCNLLCHLVTGGGDDVTAGKNCQECDSECLKVRPEGCTHNCPKPCHPGPCPPCSLNLKIKCHCSLTTLYVHCGQLHTADEMGKEAFLSCGNQCPKIYPCGHRCRSDCHSGDCPDAEFCRKKIKVTCKCGRLKKDFTCDVVRSTNTKTIECDEMCSMKKKEEEKAKELLLQKRIEEEERRNREEVERFEKKFQGRKRQRERKRSKEENSYSFSKYWLGAAVFVVSTAALIFYLTR